jgi:hypothetical protein
LTFQHYLVTNQVKWFIYSQTAKLWMSIINESSFTSNRILLNLLTDNLWLRSDSLPPISIHGIFK